MSNKHFDDVRCPICDNVVGNTSSSFEEKQILSKHVVREHENFTSYLIRLYQKSDDFGCLMSYIETEQDNLQSERYWNS